MKKKSTQSCHTIFCNVLHEYCDVCERCEWSHRIVSLFVYSLCYLFLTKKKFEDWNGSHLIYNELMILSHFTTKQEKERERHQRTIVWKSFIYLTVCNMCDFIWYVITAIDEIHWNILGISVATRHRQSLNTRANGWSSHVVHRANYQMINLHIHNRSGRRILI